MEGCLCLECLEIRGQLIHHFGRLIGADQTFEELLLREESGSVSGCSSCKQLTN